MHYCGPLYKKGKERIEHLVIKSCYLDRTYAIGFDNKITTKTIYAEGIENIKWNLSKIYI